MRASSAPHAAKWLRAVAAAVVTLSATIALAGEPASTGARTAAKPEPVSLRVDWTLQSYHGPFFLGVAKGWYRDAGIELGIGEGRGSGSVVQLVGNNSDTFGFAGADAVMRAVQNRIPVVSVATIMPRNADTMFVQKRAGVTRLQELRGKTLVTTPGGTSDTLLPAFLASAGLTVKDVTIVPVDASLKIQMLMQGRVDAAALPSWIGHQFDTIGGTIGFPFSDYGVHVIGYGIVTNTDTARTKPDLVTRFVAVTLRAWDYALDNREEMLAALAAASREHADPKRAARNRLELSDAFKLVKPAVPGKPFGTQNEGDWEAMQSQLLEYRAIKERLPVGRYISNQFVK